MKYTDWFEIVNKTTQSTKLYNNMRDTYTIKETQGTIFPWPIRRRTGIVINRGVILMHYMQTEIYEVHVRNSNPKPFVKES